MKSARKAVGVSVVLVLLSSCMQLTLRDKLDVAAREQGQPCDIKYSFAIFDFSEHRTVTYEPKLIKRYVDSTRAVLSKYGCMAEYVTDRNEAVFRAQAEFRFSRGMSAQGLLTGISLGLIPSWTTYPKQYIYTFEDTRTKKKHSYYVDVTVYAHLVLLPFAVFTEERERGVDAYEEALTNFMGGS